MMIRELLHALKEYIVTGCFYGKRFFGFVCEIIQMLRSFNDLQTE